MDSPWRRLPGTLPAALLIWAAALWGSAYFMYEPTYRPPPPPIDVQLCELPAPVATATLEPGPPAPVEQPKPPPPVVPPPVVPPPVPVKPQVRPRTIQKPVPQKAKVITSAVDAPGNALTAPIEGAPAAENTSSNNGARAGGGSGGSFEGVFGSSDGPRFLRKTIPAYPPVAKRLQKEGDVLLRVTIDERGRPVDVEIVKGAGFGFDEEAVKAVRDSTFVPAKKEGKPLACKVLLPIRFILKQS